MVAFLIIIIFLAYMSNIPLLAVIGMCIVCFLLESRILKLEERLRSFEQNANKPVDEIRPAPDTPTLANQATASHQKHKFSFSLSKISSKSLSLFKLIKTKLFSGNVIIKIGGVILFLGGVLLFNYISTIYTIPIEYKLIVSFIVGLIILILGWNSYPKREIYGTILESVGLMMMYLTIFASFHLYQLLTLIPAIMLMIMMSLISALLAMIQAARSLTWLAVLGGFLAPLLMLSNPNNYVMLLSYYLLFNMGMLAIAWFYSWWELNIFGFLFTLVITSLWGWYSYQATYFFYTEVFLILFCLFYTTISVLYALKSPDKLSTTDAVITLSTPILITLLQVTLITNIPFGMAYTSCGLSLFYFALAGGLYFTRSKVDILIHFYTILAVLFFTLCIPFSFSSVNTSSLWALESMLILWFGLRQQNLKISLTAVAMLLTSTVIYINFFLTKSNDFYVNGLILVAANLVCAWLLYRGAKDDLGFALGKLIFIVGSLGWYALNINEITIRLNGNSEIIVMLLFLSTTSLLAWIIHEFLPWSWMRFPAISLLPLLFLFSLVFGFNNYSNILILLCWLASFVIWYFILYRHDYYSQKYLEAFHLFSYLFLTYFFCSELYASLNIPSYGDTWEIIISGGIPLMMLYVVLYARNYISWPFVRYNSMYKEQIGIILIIYLLCWFGLSNFVSGNTRLIPYIPIVNPLDLFISLFLFAMWVWYKSNSNYLFKIVPLQSPLVVITAIAFIWGNSMLLRALSYWLDIPYTVSDLWQSSTAQATISIYWTLLALATTFLATRYKKRELWFLGFGLICLIIIKLALVDLSNTTPLGKIVTFIGIGVLMLANSYISPLPPKEDQL